MSASKFSCPLKTYSHWKLILYFWSILLFNNYHHHHHLSCRQHRYPWPSLATSPCRSSPLVGLQGYIPYPHIAAVCMFELVVLLLLGHMWGSIGVHHLWACPCFFFVYISSYCLSLQNDIHSDEILIWICCSCLGLFTSLFIFHILSDFSNLVSHHIYIYI